LLPQFELILTAFVSFLQLASEKEKYLKTLDELSQERKEIFDKLQTLCDKDSVIKLSGLPQEIQNVQMFIQELLDNLAGMERSMFGYKEQAEFLELESEAQVAATEQMQSVSRRMNSL
jgi:flagellar biosynthesis/type III secretory pathway chaperone